MTLPHMSTHAGRHRAMPRPIPVVIVAGFLGSGKTTLMRRLIMQAHERGLRCAVIVNEFGEVDVDASVLRQSLGAEAALDDQILGAESTRSVTPSSVAFFADDLIASLAGGCACCAGRDELSETLLELASRAPAKQRTLEQRTLEQRTLEQRMLEPDEDVRLDAEAASEGFDDAIPGFSGAIFSSVRPDAMRPDVILMEASGLADPVTLLEVVCAPDLLALVRVAALVGVVDAANYENMPATLTPLLRRQIQLADFLVLNKCDQIDESRLNTVETRLRGFNGGAQLERTTHAAMRTDIWSFVGSRESTPTMSSQSQASALAASKIDASNEAWGGASKVDEHAQSHTLVCALPHPVERARLESALKKLPDEVWRVKGFLRLRGESGWFLLQYTGAAGGGRFQLAPFFLLAGKEEPTATLVFIGSALNRDKLQRDFGSGALGALW